MTDVTINPLHIRPLHPSTVVPKTVGETGLVLGSIVYFFDDDTVKGTDADTGATVTGRVGQIVSRGHPENGAGELAIGERVGVLMLGRVSYGPDANLVLTKQYFVSNTKAKMGDVSGTVTRRLGSPESSEVFFFNSDAVAATS